jgi:phosphate transport system protein
MARERYRDDLDALRADVVALGEDVVAQLERALDALEAGDEDAAEAVVAADAEINERYLDLEQACIDLFALQQPVASDLRFVAASFKILTDLERVGDLASNLGRYTRDTPESRLDTVDVRAIGAETVALVEAALDAYEREDVAACHRVAERDDEIDALCRTAGERVVRDLLGEAAADGDAWGVEAILEDVSRALLTVRDLERVGDHAVNVAARTLYLVDNDSALLY